MLFPLDNRLGISIFGAVDEGNLERLNCFIAQLVEPATVNRVVLGSSPSEAVKKVPMKVGTFFCIYPFRLSLACFLYLGCTFYPGA